MRNKMRGFTLIELVIVIAILGILAVVAVPKFIDLSGNANTAAMSGVASAISAANGLNYGARKADSTKGVAVANCTDGASLLQGGALPSGYTIAATPVAVNATVTCTLNGPNSTTGTFSITGIS